MAALSFIFFMTMMFAYYLLKSIGYFLLATAFLLIYIATMYSFLTLRKKVVEVFENGLRMGSDHMLWNDIESVDEKGNMRFQSKDLTIPTSLHERDALIAHIRQMRASQEM